MSGKVPFVRVAFAVILLATATPVSALAAASANSDAVATLALFVMIPVLVFVILMNSPLVRRPVLRGWLRLVSSLMGVNANARVEGLPTSRAARLARIDREFESDGADFGSVDRSIAAMLAKRNPPASNAADAAPPRQTGFGRRVG